MQEIASQSTGVKLNVAVLAPDPTRRAVLEGIVRDAGGLVVDIGSADVVIAEGDIPPSSKPALIIAHRDADRGADRDADREGWLPASADARQIQAALTAIAAGLTVRPRNEPASARFDAMTELSASELLTPRELEILNEIRGGRSNKAIARTLGISLHTVKFHIESLLRKLGARTRAEAVAKALERRTAQRIDV
jgi:DNA-binding NarL/FixJ family response regulator